MVLLLRSRDFSNQSTVRLDRLALVSAAIGPNTRVIFDEQHFGIAESGSVVGLARRFRLGGMALGLALCAALFIWKNASGFPPPAAAPRCRNALRPHFASPDCSRCSAATSSPRDLAAACWSEWLASNRRERHARAPARAPKPSCATHAASPLDAMREIQTVLHAKGPL